MKKKNWKLHLYYNGVHIKTLTIDENTAPAEHVYFIKVIGKKSLFGSNLLTIAVRPKVLLDNNEKTKNTYWGVIFERGVEIK